MKEVTSFFGASSKRNKVLKEKLGNQLSSLCETRWVERHDAVMKFLEGIDRISLTLESISHWQERGPASKARCLLLAIQDTEFRVTLASLYDVLSVTSPLSRILQKTSKYRQRQTS